MKKLHPFNTRASSSLKDPRERIRPPDWSSGNTPQGLPEQKPRGFIEELAAQAKVAAHRVSITVVGVGGEGRQGTFTMPWVRGRSLSDYLRLLKLVSVAARARVYDMAHPELGRRRLNYVLEPNSHIRIGGRDFTPQAALQSNKGRDAMAIAKSMGGGAEVVEVPLVGGRGDRAAFAQPQGPMRPAGGGSMDDLDVDQA